MDLTLLYAVAIVVLIGCSAFFSMSETAFTSVNQIRLKKMANEGDVKAERTLRILEDYDRFLTTVLVGNNLVNIAGTSLATLVFSLLLGAETGAVASTVFMTVAVLTFSDHPQVHRQEQTGEGLHQDLRSDPRTGDHPLADLLAVLQDDQVHQQEPAGQRYNDRG